MVATQGRATGVILLVSIYFRNVSVDCQPSSPYYPVFDPEVKIVVVILRKEKP